MYTLPTRVRWFTELVLLDQTSTPVWSIFKFNMFSPVHMTHTVVNIVTLPSTNQNIPTRFLQLSARCQPTSRKRLCELGWCGSIWLVDVEKNDKCAKSENLVFLLEVVMYQLQLHETMTWMILWLRQISNVLVNLHTPDLQCYKFWLNVCRNFQR
jgi:hypothetical protein